MIVKIIVKIIPNIQSIDSFNTVMSALQSGHLPHADAPSPHTTRRNADVHRGPELYEDLYG